MHERFDVVIVGAGFSGLGVACHLQRQCPDLSFVLLDEQASFGGTWRTHRFPGARSDSDLHTYGFRFKPWSGPAVATSEQILDYLGAVIGENGLAPHIRYGHRVEQASWSSDTNTWTVRARSEGKGDRSFDARFLLLCQGYYRHDAGYRPSWPGMDTFEGPIVHPQTWPEDLDYRGKRVVVIGSGATAATIVPAMAGEAAHVTMLQRSPTYYASVGYTLPMADVLRALGVSDWWLHEIAKWRVLREEASFMRRIRRDPDAVARDLIADVRARLPEGFDIEKHFTPSHRPWQQRLCYVPDGDLFTAIRKGAVSMATGEIARLTPKGIELTTGETICADVIVTATGLSLSALGDIAITVDGRPIVPGETLTWHGMMLEGVPNLAFVFGYLRSSWTLRVDLVADVVCRLLNHMRSHGLAKVAPRRRAEDEAMEIGPWVPRGDFDPGYIARGGHLFPKRGDRPEWQHSHDYWIDKDRLPAIQPSDSTLAYG
ncbi:MAG: NAD(P)/FAD-dependent oxidoreductase [Hyphomicrobiales bacterium]